MSLIDAANKINRADRIAFVRRVMWSSLDSRIKIIFNSYSSQKKYTKVLGGLYYLNESNSEPVRSSNLLSFQHMNSVYILTGSRNLDVKTVNKKVKKLESATEYNCQLWYSQSPSGSVLVFIGPYRSNVGEIKEKEIIIASYKEPALIGLKHIENHFNTFFKYCSCTSFNNADNLYNYLYRQYLVYNDLRYKSNFNSKVFNLFERLALLAIAGATIWLAGEFNP